MSNPPERRALPVARLGSVSFLFGPVRDRGDSQHPEDDQRSENSQRIVAEIPHPGRREDGHEHPRPGEPSQQVQIGRTTGRWSPAASPPMVMSEKVRSFAPVSPHPFAAVMIPTRGSEKLPRGVRPSPMVTVNQIDQITSGVTAPATRRTASRRWARNHSQPARPAATNRYWSLARAASARATTPHS